MLRAKEPNFNHWNGVGGKINEGETPEACARRETYEETEFDTTLAQSRELGIVTWHDADTEPKGGMHIFLFTFPDTWERPFSTRNMREGRLEWHPLAFALNPHSPRIVENISYFLTDMLASREPLWYDFGFDAQHRIAEHHVTAAPTP